MKRLLRILLLTAAGTQIVHAETITWINTNGGNWSVAANWSPSRIPVLGDDAVITNAGNYTITLGTDTAVDRLTLGGTSGTQTLANAGFTMTLAFNNASVVNTNGVFAMTGGSLSSSGFMINGQFNWTGGFIDVGSTLTVATNGTLALAGNNGNDYYLFGVLTNAGTVKLVSGDLFLRGPTCSFGAIGELINLPGALLDLRSDVNIDTCGSTELVVNQGTVRKSGGTGTSTINTVLNNSGLVDAQTGTININGGDTAGSTGVFESEAGGTVAFVNNYTAYSGVQFTGLGSNSITGGTFTLDGLVTISNLTLAGATLTGTNGIIAGALTWTSGSIDVGSTLTVATNGTVTLTGNNGNDYYLFGVLTNAGTVKLVSGNLFLRGPTCSFGAIGELINLPGALLDLQSDVNIHTCGSTELVVNQGTVRKSGGTGTSTINTILNNSGLVDAQTGTININGGGNDVSIFEADAGAALNVSGGTFTFASPIQFTGAGTNLITGGALTLSGSLTPPKPLLVTGGTLAVNGLVTISNLTLAGATLAGTNGVIAGALTWTSGSIDVGSTLTVATNGTLELMGNNGSDYFLYGILTNAGTIKLVTGNLQLRGGACSFGAIGELVNLPGALLDLQTDVNIDVCGGSELLVNQGTIRKSGGTGTSTIHPTLSNSGLVAVHAGTISINGGDTAGSTGVFQTEASATLTFINNYTAYSGVQFTGVGSNLATGGTFTLDGLVTISNLTLAGATLAGTSGVIAGVLPWTSGSIDAGSTLTVATNGTLVLAGNNGSDYALLGILTNAGTVKLVSGNLQLLGATCNVGAIGELINLPGALLDLRNDVNIDTCGGTELLVNQGIVRKSGGTGTTTIHPILNNSGLVDAQTGTVNINGGDTTGSTGVFQTEAGATLDFPNSFTAYSGVQFTGVGTNIITGGTFTLDGLVTISNLTLAGATLAGTSGVIAGVLPWTSGSIAVGSTLTVATNGTLVLAGNNGTDYPLLGILTNAGTVKLVSGNLQLLGATCNDGAIGELINLPGALLDLQNNVNIDKCGSTELLVNQGTVRKSGGTGTSTIHPILNNSGLVDAQTGTVSLAGSYDLANGTLNFGISSLASFGKINLSGSPANLAGSVSANLNNGFVPATSSSFTVLTYSTHTGIFAGADFPAVASWETNYGPFSFTISVGGVNGLVFTTQPVGGVFTNKILAPVVVQVESSGGSPIATNGVPVTLSLDSGSGIMSGTLTQNTDPTGKATFSDLSFNPIGTKTLRAASPGWATATSSSFAIVSLIGAQWTGNGFVLSLNGTNSPLSTIISASTNLVSWAPIYTNAPTNGPIIFLDPASKTLPYRFYSILQR